MSGPRARPLLLAAIGAAALWAAWRLGLLSALPGREGVSLELLGRFAGAALSPALRSESDLVLPLLPQAAAAAVHTVAFAAAATSLSLVAGALLGVLASTRWWALVGPGPALAAPLYAALRMGIGAMRSVHEVLWALLLLAAFGLHAAAAVLAIAIPYAGTLAKVFSEMLDEAPDDTAGALAAAGATPAAVFVFGLVPRALPDLSAYAFYRFECALRAAAVLGFFGFPTLGKHVYEATGQLHFHEAWTYLYVLIALVGTVEIWSAALRQRLSVA